MLTKQGSALIFKSFYRSLRTDRRESRHPGSSSFGFPPSSESNILEMSSWPLDAGEDYLLTKTTASVQGYGLDYLPGKRAGILLNPGSLFVPNLLNYIGSSQLNSSTLTNTTGATAYIDGWSGPLPYILDHTH